MPISEFASSIMEAHMPHHIGSEWLFECNCSPIFFKWWFTLEARTGP